jgi:rSAM/selenodomain-associated transferase 2
MGGAQISVIIPVLGEGDRVGEQLAALRALEGGPESEIVVVDGDPAGGTLREMRDADARPLTAPPGRGVQMNAGAAASRGRFLLFLHVDTLLPERAFPRIRETLATGERLCGAFRLAIVSPCRSHRVAGRLATLRSRLTREPYGDQGLFVAREHFQAVGGFRPLPLLEDIDFVRRFKRAGGRVRMLPDVARTSARRLFREGLFYCALRNTALVLLFDAGVPAEALSRFYPLCPGGDRR